MEGIIHESYAQIDPAIPPTQGCGPAILCHQMLTYRSAFPALHFSIEETVTEGEKVVVSFTACGTHSGATDWLGIISSGLQVEAKGVSINHMVDGKIVASQLYWYPMGLLQRLRL